MSEGARQLVASPLWELLDSPVATGDCVALLATVPEASVDAVVCDPPYGLEFMGNEWDKLDTRQPDDETFHRSGAGPFDRAKVRHASAPSYGGSAGQEMEAWHLRWAREAFRALKPGGHLLAFGGPRTYHRLASAVEDAGFEIRDSVMWLFASGFPKSRDVGADTAEAAGWGTALKPAHEPILMARKPLVGTVAANFLEHGTGAVNVAATRIEHAGAADLAASKAKNPGREDLVTSEVYGAGRPQQSVNDAGRWPSNLVLSHAEECGDSCVAGCPAGALDEASGERPGGGYPRARGANSVFNPTSGGSDGPRDMGDTGGASRFFFTGKTSRSEREAGLDESFEPQPLNWSSEEQSPGTFQSDGTEKSSRNPHPTVKPIDLMRWLALLVTPAGGLVLDPFCGSGSTGCAAVLEGFDFVGFDLSAEFVRVSRARIAHWSRYEGQKTKKALASAVVERERSDAGQLGLLA